MFNSKENNISITIIGIPETRWEPNVKVKEIVCLCKEPNNSVDDEAILVKNSKGEKVGYVANSTKTVIRGTYSAGRLYDKFDTCMKAKIKYKIGDGSAIAEVGVC